jgi:serpin B
MSSSPSAFGGAFAAAFASALCFTCGCGGGQTGDEQTGDAGSLLQELRGTAARVVASGSLPNSASQDGWDFGWKFYHEEARPDQNAFFSPYSISTALAMLVAGAGGETKSEIDSALSFSNDDGPAFHEARNAVARALEARNHQGSESQQPQALRVSNDLWLETQYRPAPAFLDTLSAYYGAGVFLAPFVSDPEASRRAINQQVARETEQLIPEILPEGSIDPLVRFVLTNALYFKARWGNEFDKEQTRNEPFVSAAGTSTVPMMHATFETRYFAGPDYQALALPYFGNELELVAIMPAEGSFEAYVSQLDAEGVSTAIASLATKNLQLGFPKFELTSEVPLKERLQALGMRQAFQDDADFDQQLGPNLYISDAFHQATISLDEQGTEASAATALVGRDVSLPPPSIPVVFDHPFVFLIRDVQSNALLFVGHFAKP